MRNSGRPGEVAVTSLALPRGITGGAEGIGEDSLRVQRCPSRSRESVAGRQLMSDTERDAASARFEGVRILLVEDETTLSFLIEDMLKELGCANIWHASGVNQTIAILRDCQPDAAVLDVNNLAGEPGYPIAEHLESARIPFLFATGYGHHGIPKQWASKPTIQKPFRYDALATALGSLLGR